MIKSLSILALTALALLPSRLYSVNSEIDTIKMNTFRSKRESIPVINTINKDYIIRVKKSTGKIKLDGNFDEEDWRKGEVVNHFHMVLPYDTGHCVARSEIMMTYDEKAFYLAIIFHDTVPGKRPVESLRRDFVFTNNDNFVLFIDPFNDQTTGYSLGVNDAGAQRDGGISDGHVNNLMWDCKWESVTKNFSDRWTSEIRIPFKSIRYKPGVDHWGVQFSRNDMKLNEKSD